ncbi:MAG: type II secretion system F family protein [Patescibacteria group bacterium]
MLYSFRAKNFKGEEIKGVRDAENEAELARYLRNDGYFLIESEASGARKKSVGISFGRLLRRVSLAEKMIFSRHLSVMIGAGLSLTRALEVLSRQTNNNYFRKIILNIGRNITKGKSFADSLANYPRVFSDLFVNMVRVGEVGGNLEEVLKSLAYQMEKDYELRSKVRGAFMYPAVIVVAMVIIGIIMMIFVVPKLTATFAELKINLPVTTRFVIFVSNFLAHHTLIFIGSFAVFIYFAVKIIKSKKGGEAIDFLSLNIPILRNITIKINTARMARTLSSLLKSGMAITEAIEMVSHTLTNKYFSSSLVFSVGEVKKGKVFSDVLGRYEKLYPPLVTQMIAVGEETGTMDDILARLADFYEEEVYNITKNLSTIIEPILMIFIGAAVGFFAISMIQPMYSIVEGI